MENCIFKRISVIGRIAYGVMCVEEYLLSKYPTNNWTLVMNKFWEITNLDLWDNWMNEVIEIIPEYLFEFPDYESSGFEYLTIQDYNNYKKVYEGMDSDVNTILKAVYDLANSHAYSSIVGIGKESIQALSYVVEILEKNKIPLPDVKRVEFNKFSYKNGWGELFDGKSLSKIVN